MEHIQLGAANILRSDEEQGRVALARADHGAKFAVKKNIQPTRTALQGAIDPRTYTDGDDARRLASLRS